MSSLIMTHGLLRIIALLHFFLVPISISSEEQWSLRSSPPQWAAEEEKSRLGSMPPSCHNRCNTCNPCTAVQVPTLPGPIGRFPWRRAEKVQLGDQAAYSQYNSNYKPLGWMCRCGGAVYNP